jgi:hypothetical protein
MTKELTQQELIRIYSAYLPYNLKIQTSYDGIKFNKPKKLKGSDLDRIGKRGVYYKPILMPIENITKEELLSVGLSENCHIDWITNERKYWIDKYGFEKWLKRVPYGHFNYLLSKHYNILGLDDSQYINKATLKN